MRIRSIKPEFWRSPDILALSLFERLLFIGLWNLADDEGRGRYDPTAIAADLFLREYSLNPHGVLTEVSNAFSTYEKQQMVAVYEVENRQYFEILGWADHQKINRPTKSKIPPKSMGSPANLENHGGLTEDSVSNHGGLTIGTGNRDQGSGIDTCTSDDVRAPSKKQTRNTYSEAFEAWWAIYPRKAGKRRAFKRWQEAIKRISPDELNEKTRLFRAYTESENTSLEYIKYPEGWLSGDCWEDELIPRKAKRESSWWPPADSNVIAGEVVEMRELEVGGSW